MASIPEKMDRRRTRKSRIGLIVNPIAGMGGRVGLKGTDGFDVYLEALRKGARPEAGQKVLRALGGLECHGDSIEWLTCQGAMGEDVLKQLGYGITELIEVDCDSVTAPADTMRAVIEMNRWGADLIVFAGGDGTARNVSAVNVNNTLCIGIPAGVKIQSSCFARTPREAGTLIQAFANGRISRIRDAEVVDLDEALYRQGIVAPKFYNTLIVPDMSNHMQSKKFRTPSSDRGEQMEIATEVVKQMDEGLYLIGPGSTTQGIMDRLKLPSTLIGVDAVQKGRIVGLDLSEQEILKLIRGQKVKLVLTPVGGQGFLIGRGNQQVSSEVMRRIGKENLMVVATNQKLNQLADQKMFVDTGDVLLDQELNGYIRVITGIGQVRMFRVG